MGYWIRRAERVPVTECDARPISPSSPARNPAALIDADGHTSTVSDLTSTLVSQQAERTGVRLGRDEIEMQIHHTHLPKLTEVGVVEYDARSQELRYWRHERLEDYLEFVQPDEPSE